MRNERFFKNNDLPFAERRYSLCSAVPFKPHIHNTLSIGAVDQGEVFCTVNTRKSILAPGSLVVINPETLHSCNPISETARSYHMLHLYPDWCYQVQEAMWEVSQFVEIKKNVICRSAERFATQSICQRN